MSIQDMTDEEIDSVLKHALQHVHETKPSDDFSGGHTMIVTQHTPRYRVIALCFILEDGEVIHAFGRGHDTRAEAEIFLNECNELFNTPTLH